MSSREQSGFLREAMAPAEWKNAEPQSQPGASMWAINMLTGEIAGSEEFYDLYSLDRNVSLSFDRWMQAIHASDRARVSDELRSAIRSGRRFDSCFRLQRAGGEVRWIEAKGKVVADHRGQATLMSGLDSDITERQKREDHRLFLSAIVESSDDAIIGKTLDGIITSWNAGAERIFGYRAEEVIGKSITVLAWPGHEEDMPQILERIRQGERVEHFETVRRHRDGRAVHVSLTISPVRDASGAVVGASKIARDIGERKRNDKALREAELRYRDLFENSPTSVSVVDPESARFVDFNRMFCERLGYTAREAAELRIDDVAPDYHRLLMRALAKKRPDAEQVQFVTSYRTRSGEMLDTLVFARPMRREGRVVVHSIAFDLSAQRRVDEALRQLREKESLLKEIHHRVKNNLQVVSSLLGLQSRGIADPQMRRLFQESQNRIHSMALLHESLYQSENLSRVDFPAYIRQLAAYLFQSYGVTAKHVQLRTELDDLSLGMDAAVPCGLIINELLSNSLKYAFPEGREGEVRIVLQGESGGRTKLVVADNGVGMDQGIDWTRAKSLGLRLVRTLAQQLDAQLEFGSAVGTEVRLTFSAAA